MTTSANSIEYTIFRDGERVGNFRKNIMCKKPDYAELLKYQPLSEHTIQAWGYDEEEDEWEEKPKNLEKYLRRMIQVNKKIREFFSGEKTANQIMQEIEEEKKEEVRKMHEYFAKKKIEILNELSETKNTNP